jgi:hypothetical protein
MTGSTPATKDSNGNLPGLVHVARRLTAGAIFLVVTLGVGATYVPGGPRVCRDQLAGSGSLVSVCQPAGLNDAILIGLLLLLAILFLLPDISEFGIAGLLSMKMRQRITATERKASAAEGKADRAEAELMYVAMAAPAPSTKTIARAAHNATVKSNRQPTISVPTRLLSPERMDLEQRFWAASAGIDRYLRLPRSRLAQFSARQPGELPDQATYLPIRLQQLLRADGVPPRSTEAVLDAIRIWQGGYELELSAFARVRNVFAHGPERLSDDDLSAATDLGEGLLSAVRRAIADVPAAVPTPHG